MVSSHHHGYLPPSTEGHNACQAALSLEPPSSGFSCASSVCVFMSGKDPSGLLALVHYTVPGWFL